MADVRIPITDNILKKYESKIQRLVQIAKNARKYYNQYHEIDENAKIEIKTIKGGKQEYEVDGALGYIKERINVHYVSALNELKEILGE